MYQQSFNAISIYHVFHFIAIVMAKLSKILSCRTIMCWSISKNAIYCTSFFLKAEFASAFVLLIFENIFIKFIYIISTNTHTFIQAMRQKARAAAANAAYFKFRAFSFEFIVDTDCMNKVYYLLQLQQGAANWEHSSAGRALALQARGHRFEPCCSHHTAR